MMPLDYQQWSPNVMATASIACAILATLVWLLFGPQVHTSPRYKRDQFWIGLTMATADLWIEEFTSWPRTFSARRQSQSGPSGETMGMVSGTEPKVRRCGLPEDGKNPYYHHWKRASSLGPVR